MIRKHKKYNKPRKMYDKSRIEGENKLVEKYGLKSKREIWKAESAVDEIRGQAKKLITSNIEEQNKFIERLNKIGLKVEKIADVLALNKEDLLKRRLQSIILEKNLAKTPKQARQMIAHKHVRISGNAVNIPSYIVKTDEESEISLVKVKTKEMSKAENESKNKQEEAAE